MRASSREESESRRVRGNVSGCRCARCSSSVAIVEPVRLAPERRKRRDVVVEVSPARRRLVDSPRASLARARPPIMLVRLSKSVGHISKGL